MIQCTPNLCKVSLTSIFFINKGTVIVNLSDTSCKDSDIRFTKVPLKP